MPEPVHVSEFDLQPHPRILPMLGEINLQQWSCIAELVDNAVDAFLNVIRAGVALANPEVHVTLPTTDSPNARIQVRDNGPGMDPTTLENAVRAGWTGNDPISNLGMFGMGFNIATARLGTTTRIWTTRQGDTEWCGLDIDFDRLVRQRHFRTPRLTRPKIDPVERGTEVTIEHLKPEQRAWFSRTANRSKLVKQLERVYSSMLRPNGVPLSFRLYINGTQARGHSHCIWGGEATAREVQTSRYGLVNAYQTIDRRLPDRPFCALCWQWLSAGEQNCPACGSSENVVQRQRHVHGWLGIQRFLSSNDYGIDFLRHGRKIEIANKDLFSWTSDGVQEEEYPIDDPRHRGRIVGEIHVDHCRVTYTKDRFDRNDPAWEEMLRIIRGEGPLRPDKAGELGFGANNSPLFLLFQAFRRSSPKPKVAGCYAKLLIVPDNDRAEEMAKHFFAGEPQYQTDAKWWELIEEADRALLTPQPTGAEGASAGLEGFGPDTTRGGAAGGATGIAPQPEAPPAQPPQRTAIAHLTREYHDELTRFRWNVQAFDVEASDPDLGDADRPWRLTTTASGLSIFLVNSSHPAFRSSTLTPLDGLLAELAWHAMDFQRGNPGNATFADVLASLRERYAVTHKLDPVALSAEAVATLTATARSLANNVDAADSAALFDELSPAEREAVLRRMASRSVGNPQQTISAGRFLEYAPRKTLLTFFERHPELFLDGRYWDTPYASLDYGETGPTEEARSQVVRHYGGLLADAIWLAEQDPGDLADMSRARLVRAALAIELLSPSGVEAQEGTS